MNPWRLEIISLLLRIHSGGHFNPAVTLGVLIAGGIELKKALLYILIQLIGGAMAAGIFRVPTENCFSKTELSFFFSSSFSLMLVLINIVVVEQQFSSI